MGPTRGMEYQRAAAAAQRSAPLSQRKLHTAPVRSPLTLPVTPDSMWGGSYHWDTVGGLVPPPRQARSPPPQTVTHRVQCTCPPIPHVPGDAGGLGHSLDPQPPTLAGTLTTRSVGARPKMGSRCPPPPPPDTRGGPHCRSGGRNGGTV